MERWAQRPLAQQFPRPNDLVGDLVDSLHLEDPLHPFNQFISHAPQTVRNRRNSEGSQVTVASDETALRKTGILFH